MNLTAKLTCPQVVHINYDSQYFLASSFMRIQEFYESPFENIRGKAFTLFDYMDTEVRNNGKFNYFDKWSGFNFPDYILKQFLKTQKVLYFNQEALKFVYIKSLVEWDKPFYVIGTYGKDSKVYDHELAHAFYYLSAEYKFQMDMLIGDIPPKKHKRILKNLSETGYTEKVFKDEIQAYISTSPSLYFGDISKKTENNFRDIFDSFKYEFTKD